MRKILRSSLAILIVSILGTSELCRADVQRSEMMSLRRNVATVIFTGLGGAVLGLSTLSFYGKPEEHTGNIYVGLVVGLLAGTSYIFMQSQEAGWSAEQKPMQYFAEISEPPRPRSRRPDPSEVPVFSYRFTF